ncbi:MAG: hypothetical protein Q4F95_00750 [Oscillospiraceae bacterium]|nr:hypothetical protein [Oscillospiraceae bacterium]
MRGKKPTRRQKIILSNYPHLNAKNWLIVRETEKDLMILHRYTDKIRTIHKEN